MPDPATPQSASQKASALLTALSKALPAFGGMFGGGPQAGGGGRGPLVSSGMQGQVPAAPGVPQVAGAGAGAGTGAGMSMPGRMAGPMGSPSQNQPVSQGPPQSGLMQSGFEFQTPKGRDAAVVTSAIQGVTQFLSQAKEKKEAKTRAQAEGYMSQIHAAQASGDQDALNLLLTDPKVVSTLEKGLNYLMPKTPGEAPPPEAHGVKKFLDKISGKDPRATNPNGPRLPTPNTPGGVVMPRAPQSASNTQGIQDVISKAALAAIQNDPELAKRMGIGSGLSGEEANKAERYQAGLATSPAAERQAYLAHQDLLDKFEHENKMVLAELASHEKIAAGATRSAEEQARISAGPMYQRAQIAREIGLAQVEARKLVSKGKVNEANKIMMQTLTSQINNLRTNSEKARKDDNSDLAADFSKQADDLQKRYDEVQKLSETNLDDLVNSILND